MCRIIGFIVVGCLSFSVFAGVYIPSKERSKVKNTSYKLSKTSDATKFIYYYVRKIKVDVTGDNRNRTDLAVSIGVYFIGRNKNGLYKLIETQSTTANMKKNSRKNKLATVKFQYLDYHSNQYKLRHRKNNKWKYQGKEIEVEFEYRGCLTIIKGPEGKIITVEGEYAKLYKFIESKAKGNIFNSKGEEKVPSKFD